MTRIKPEKFRPVRFIRNLTDSDNLKNYNTLSNSCKQFTSSILCNCRSCNAQTARAVSINLCHPPKCSNSQRCMRLCLYTLCLLKNQTFRDFPFSTLAKQHFLYFFPLPQKQGSFRFGNLEPVTIEEIGGLVLIKSSKL